VVHVSAVPQRLEDAVGEAQHHQVLHGLLAQVVVDAVDLVLRERLGEGHVLLLGALQVVANRLLDDDAREGAQVVSGVDHARGLELSDAGLDRRRRHG
jgi:hypothetical protein